MRFFKCSNLSSQYVLSLMNDMENSFYLLEELFIGTGHVLVTKGQEVY